MRVTNQLLTGMILQVLLMEPKDIKDGAFPRWLDTLCSSENMTIDS